jgi:hypothetical protein
LVRDSIRLNLERHSADEFVGTLANDQIVNFYRYVEEALLARYGPPAAVDIGSNGWPHRLRFILGPYKGKSYSFSVKEAPLFRSDMDNVSAWQVNRYGFRGDFEILPDGLTRADRSAKYTSGDRRDALASPFFDFRSEETRMIFFSLWAKPIGENKVPVVSLQDDNFTFIARAYRLETRQDGWVFLTGWLENKGSKRIRVIIQQKPGSASLLDKVLVLEVPLA